MMPMCAGMPAMMPFFYIPIRCILHIMSLTGLNPALNLPH